MAFLAALKAQSSSTSEPKSARLGTRNPVTLRPSQISGPITKSAVIVQQCKLLLLFICVQKNRKYKYTNKFNSIKCIKTHPTSRRYNRQQYTHQTYVTGLLMVRDTAVSRECPSCITIAKLLCRWSLVFLGGLLFAASLRLIFNDGVDTHTSPQNGSGGDESTLLLRDPCRFRDASGRESTAVNNGSYIQYSTSIKKAAAGEKKKNRR